MRYIEIKVNNLKIRTPKKRTILEVCKKVNIKIPTLCDYPGLPPYGGCRLCIVEIEGKEGVFTACTTQVEEGMNIKTNTKRIKELRKNILELILSDHPHTCMFCEEKESCTPYQYSIRKVGITTGCKFCPKDGKCSLVKVVEEVGLKEMSFPTNYKNLSPQNIDPFFSRDYNLCILCGRCVRVCEELGEGVIGFGWRGDKLRVTTSFDKPLQDSGCEFCGRCVEVCPVGAIVEKRGKWYGVGDKKVKTTCPYCSMGCEVLINLKEGKIVNTQPYRLKEICLRGKFGINYIAENSHTRITTPLVKVGNTFKPLSWESAVKEAIRRLKKYKPEEIGFIASTQWSNEDSVGFKVLAERLGVKNLCTKEENELPSVNWVGVNSIIKGGNENEIYKKITQKKIKALYVGGKIDQDKLKGVELLLLNSPFYPNSLKIMHLFFPVKTFLETQGTIFNHETKLRYWRKVLLPPSGVKSDLDVFNLFLSQLGPPLLSSKDIKIYLSHLKPFSISFPAKLSLSSGNYSYRGFSFSPFLKSVNIL